MPSTRWRDRKGKEFKIGRKGRGVWVVTEGVLLKDGRDWGLTVDWTLKTWACRDYRTQCVCGDNRRGFSLRTQTVRRGGGTLPGARVVTNTAHVVTVTTVAVPWSYRAPRRPAPRP